jgi:HAD superfamily hydrolase (TIGR01509 family)
MRFQGIVFDFNGVLWWDTHLQDLSWQQFSAGLRGTPLSAAEMSVHVYGRNNRYTLEYLTGRAIEAGELDELVQEKEAVYRRLCLAEGEKFRLSPGAVELLDWLAARHIPRTIATASERTNLDFFVSHLHLDRWFDVERIVYDDGTRPGKPAPDLYLQAAAAIRLAPRRCVVVEDSQSGLRAARAAGAGYLIALGPADRHAQLAGSEGVSLVIETLGQVPREELFL